MKRKSIQKQCSLKVAEQEELFQAFLSVCTYNEIFYLWRPNLKDTDDDFLVELAVASNSSFIITENIKDLKSNELHFDFKTVTAKEFLKRKKP
jgi:predicted nucleic acid-binding protein